MSRRRKLAQQVQAATWHTQKRYYYYFDVRQRVAKMHNRECMQIEIFSGANLLPTAKLQFIVASLDFLFLLLIPNISALPVASFAKLEFVGISQKWVKLYISQNGLASSFSRTKIWIPPDHHSSRHGCTLKSVKRHVFP